MILTIIEKQGVDLGIGGPHIDEQTHKKMNIGSSVLLCTLGSHPHPPTSGSQ